MGGGRGNSDLSRRFAAPSPFRGREFPGGALDLRGRWAWRFGPLPPLRGALPVPGEGISGGCVGLAWVVGAALRTSPAASRHPPRSGEGISGGCVGLAWAVGAAIRTSPAASRHPPRSGGGNFRGVRWTCVGGGRGASDLSRRFAAPSPFRGGNFRGCALDLLGKNKRFVQIIRFPSPPSLPLWGRVARSAGRGRQRLEIFSGRGHRSPRPPYVCFFLCVSQFT